jgi:hypothetical protein
VNVPDLKFGELKDFFDQNVCAGCKVDLRIANDYLDVGSVEFSKITGQLMEGLLAYCAKVVKDSPPMRGQAKVIDVSKGWSEDFIIPERHNAPPPAVIFLEASASSIINLGLWINELQNLLGDSEKGVEMNSDLNKFLQKFFGMPFKPCAMVSHQSSATPSDLKKALGRTILGSNF